ncbi:hypothetical protein [Desulfocicer niacini]
MFWEKLASFIRRFSNSIFILIFAGLAAILAFAGHLLDLKDKTIESTIIATEISEDKIKPLIGYKPIIINNKQYFPEGAKISWSYLHEGASNDTVIIDAFRVIVKNYEGIKPGITVEQEIDEVPGKGEEAVNNYSVVIDGEDVTVAYEKKNKKRISKFPDNLLASESESHKLTIKKQEPEFVEMNIKLNRSGTYEIAIETKFTTPSGKPQTIESNSIFLIKTKG